MTPAMGGFDPLCVAAENGHLNIVELFLAQPEANVNCRDTYGRTPLASAAARGHEAIVDRLLQEPSIEANATDGWGETPFFLAVINGYPQVLKLLGNRDDVDVNLGDEDGRTPLIYTAEAGLPEALGPLLDFAFIKMKPGLDAAAWEALQVAETNENWPFVKVMLERRVVDVNCWAWGGATLLTNAIRLKRQRMFDILISLADTDVNRADKHGRYPIFESMMPDGRETRWRMFEALVDHPEIDLEVHDDTGRTPFLATFDIPCLRIWWLEKLVFDPRVNPHAEHENGRTVLSKAIAKPPEGEWYEDPQRRNVVHFIKQRYQKDGVPLDSIVIHEDNPSGRNHGQLKPSNTTFTLQDAYDQIIDFSDRHAQGKAGKLKGRS